MTKGWEISLGRHSTCCFKRHLPPYYEEDTAGTSHSCLKQKSFHSKPGAPCYLSCSDYTHVPKHETMACAVEAAPHPRTPPPPSRRHVKHTLWQADDSMTQTYIQRGLRHVRCSLSTSLTL